ncbi:TSUP family transporter [Sansalvadorimonas sp. 2012CJ34-2]|uniref:Probable membrane transporter protein n=1 Tax=Parendozoicomonas callyspongiae TaxID=2942213 RepID=A0ABT0PDK8_9GAMM|nr:TSUP family transporter [Sansalvadorimonas sp. 2012CJ34-2]MCL6269393.1 TSUP family transporter [Sansalvadorimonas sp. 2012CJ34-2]
MLVILFFVGGIAGCIDAMAGGGGLITIPAMLSMGIPPLQTLATNKLQACGGSFSASLYFVRAGAVNLREMWFPIVCTFLGSAAGAILVQQIHAEVLTALIPFLLIGIAVYFLLSKRLDGGNQRVTLTTFALTAGFGVGFYDGFFGPGTGSFFAMFCVVLLGHSLPVATAHTKVLNFTSNISSLGFFLAGGHVIVPLGLVMMAGQFIGARIGSKMVMTKGQQLIRPMIVVICLVMSAKLLWESFGLFCFF